MKKSFLTTFLIIFGVILVSAAPSFKRFNAEIGSSIVTDFTGKAWGGSSPIFYGNIGLLINRNLLIGVQIGAMSFVSKISAILRYTLGIEKIKPFVLISGGVIFFPRSSSKILSVYIGTLYRIQKNFCVSLKTGTEIFYVPSRYGGPKTSVTASGLSGGISFSF